jgi:hypothetical protein
MLLSYAWISLKIAMLTPYNSLWFFPIILELYHTRVCGPENLTCAHFITYIHLIGSTLTYYKFWNVQHLKKTFSKVLLSTTSNYHKCITKHKSPTKKKSPSSLSSTLAHQHHALKTYTHYNKTSKHLKLIKTSHTMCPKHQKFICVPPHPQTLHPSPLSLTIIFHTRYKISGLQVVNLQVEGPIIMDKYQMV